ncbi:hypothetical protein EJB05_32972, partial [Eragrostis curvula]
METIYNTIVEKIVSRSISFFIDKCSTMTEPSMEDKSEHNLQRLLLRARVIVEEAEGRDITNQAMVHQLNILRKEMYRGYYTLDNFRSQEGEPTKVNDQGVSHSFALSKFNSAKRLFLSSRNTHDKEELEQVSESLHSIICDMNEFKVFLENYSPLYRQPYSMHLFLDNCMFARQMEMDFVMNFLVRAEFSSAESVGILPIVGPPAVGKSTLVSHVCSNERVRNLFSRIVLVTEDDLKDPCLNTSNDNRVIKYQNDASNGNEAILVIIELPKDIDEDTWKGIYSIFVGRIARGSKILITSRSSKITKFGTTQALVLNYLTREAFWYFFKVVTFGSADPEEQPKLASMAMEIGMGINGSFIGANLIGGLLRSNLNIEFWSKVLNFARMYVQMNMYKFGEHPNSLLQKNKSTYFRRMASADYCVVRNQYQTSFDHGEVPTITFEDVLFGSVECRGRVQVLAWRSQIPPHKNHIFSCDIRKPRRRRMAR